MYEETGSERDKCATRAHNLIECSVERLDCLSMNTLASPSELLEGHPQRHQALASHRWYDWGTFPRFEAAR